jgi:WD40 repeat protein
MTEAEGFHPNPDQLTAFDRGQLDPEEWTAVEGHVARCARCCHRLESLPGEDALISLLRASVGQGTPAAAGPADTQVGGEDTGTTPPSAGARPRVPAELAAHPRYRVLGLVGVGGMGAVFKAEHRLMERVVALKVIRRNLIDRPGAVERFRQEVRAAARLVHPNIVIAHDADEAGDFQFLVMEFVEGASLDRLVREGGPLSVADACSLARQAALGLQHAHERGMVHRDIKPGNLLLTADGRVKVLDFGLARFVSEMPPGEGLTPSGAVVGTPDYMAPEQARDPRTADIRADLYALGCTLYYLLAGRPPFAGGTALQTLLAHQDEAPPPLAGPRPDVPPALDEVVARLLAKEPARRYQSPAEVADALAPFTDPVAAVPVPPVVLTVVPQPAVAPMAPASRRRWLFVSVAGLFVAAVALGGLLGWVRTRPGAPEPRAAPGRAVLPAAPAELHRYAGEDGPFTSVAFSADGRHALAAGADHVLRLWDLDDGREAGRLAGHTDTVLTVAFSPDGRRALSAGADRTVRLWDLGERRQLAELAGHTGSVRCVRFCGDGRHAVSAGDDGRVLLWDTEGVAAKRKEVRGPASTVNALTTDSAGRFSLTACSDNALRLWDLESAQILRTYAGHAGPVLCATSSGDGSYVLSGGADRTVRLWRGFTDRELARFDGHTAEVTCVALAPDNRWALSGSADRTVRLWDVGGAREVARFEGHTDGVVAVAFSADGRRALSAGRDGTLRAWRLPEGLEPTPARYLEQFTAVALAPDGKNEALSIADERVQVRRVVTTGGQTSLRDRGVLWGHTAGVVALAFAPDSRTLASGGWDATVRLWDISTGGDLAVLAGHTGAVRSLAFTGDGATLVSGSADGTVKLWDVAGRRERATLAGHAGPVRSVAVTPDGRTVVSGGDDGTVRLWDGAAFEPRTVLTGHAGTVRAVAVAPDGRLVASGGEDGALRLWDAASGRRRGDLAGDGEPVWALAVSANGRVLASAGGGTAVRLWSLAGGKELRSLDMPARGVTALGFTADGTFLIAGGLDGRARAWAVGAVVNGNGKD